MIYKAFTLLDTKTGIHNPPFFMAHIGQAIRAVQDLGSDLSTSVGRHPADYMLVELGSYDDETGGFHNAYNPVATVVNLLEPATQANLFKSTVEA